MSKDKAKKAIEAKIAVPGRKKLTTGAGKMCQGANVSMLSAKRVLFDKTRTLILDTASAPCIYHWQISTSAHCLKLLQHKVRRFFAGEAPERDAHSAHAHGAKNMCIDFLHD